MLLLISCLVVSDSLWPHGQHHTRLPCSSLSPGVHSNWCPLSWWCHLIISSLLPAFPPALNLSQHQGLFTELALNIRWTKYWSFSFSKIPSNEYSWLFFFRIHLFDLLAIQGTLKSLLQHYSSKASTPRHSVSFIVQLSHPYKTTAKMIALIIWTFVGKVMSLLFNTLSRFVIVFLPRTRCLYLVKNV